MYTLVFPVVMTNFNEAKLVLYSLDSHITRQTTYTKITTFRVIGFVLMRIVRTNTIIIVNFFSPDCLLISCNVCSSLSFSYYH